MPAQFNKLLARLNLETENEWTFIGGSGVGGVTEANRLFGGLVVAQAVVAAARTATSLALHSMHAYFLRPGRPDAAIQFAVEPIKQGKNFQTRNVQGRQGDQIIFQMLASFSHMPDMQSEIEANGIRHQDPMRPAPSPLSLPNRDELRERANWQDNTIDVRLCDPLTKREPLAPTKAVWLKPSGTVPKDPITQLALLVFATDRTLLSTAWRPHADKGALQGASLDHSIWIHAPIRFDDWHLYQMHSPAAAFERGLVHGAVYRQDGVRLASVSQEGTLTHRPHPVASE